MLMMSAPFWITAMMPRASPAPVSIPERRLSPILQEMICAPGAQPSMAGSSGWCAAAMPATWVPWGEESATTESTLPSSYTCTPKLQAAARLKVPYLYSTSNSARGVKVASLAPGQAPSPSSRPSRWQERSVTSKALRHTEPSCHTTHSRRGPLSSASPSFLRVSTRPCSSSLSFWSARVEGAGEAASNAASASSAAVVDARWAACHLSLRSSTTRLLRLRVMKEKTRAAPTCHLPVGFNHSGLGIIFLP
mmetsp:Transcript_31055/g.99156  ORF Transcript_31055/g.99156 Transcript_31055/m.99156 type:complete len:250 (-) Transcript_31055:579-1328(-)